MGINTKESNPSSSNYIKEFHKLGGGRFPTGRKSVAEMAQDIGEKKSTSSQMTLYELYQLLSDKCHNSYFLHV